MSRFGFICVFTLSLTLSYSFSGFGQESQKYWVEFCDKAVSTNTTKTVSEQTKNYRQRMGIPILQQTDLPVNPEYVQELKNYGAKIHFSSKWLNAVSVTFDISKSVEIENLPFVASVSPVNQQLKVMETSASGYNPDLTAALDQINGWAVLNEKLDGEGISIGIIDVGYFGAMVNTSLKKLFSNRKIGGSRDYLDPENDKLFSNKQSFSNSHGTTVWQKIGGYNETTNVLYGLAPDATYFLARTDNTKFEFRGEEDYWIAAIEWMDSLGIRLVNTSLGYSLGFDNPEENYSPEQMDGKSTKISKAAQIAANEKGMLLVVAAGNEGHQSNWRIVSAPADAEGVLSVGATKHGSQAKVGYSSTGPEFVDYLKPNVSCFSPNGTSFSAPVITGLAACLWQKNPNLSGKEVKEIIERSGSLYPFGNNFVGYGVPDAFRALKLATDPKTRMKENKSVKARGNEISIPLEPDTEETIILFHKKNKWHVIQQQEVIHQENKLIIERPEDMCAYTTVALPDKTIEIIWPD